MEPLAQLHDQIRGRKRLRQLQARALAQLHAQTRLMEQISETDSGLTVSVVSSHYSLQFGLADVLPHELAAICLLQPQIIAGLVVLLERAVRHRNGGHRTRLHGPI